MLTRQDDDTVGKTKVSAVLEALPGAGKVRARKIMERPRHLMELAGAWIGSEAARVVAR